MIDLSPIRYDCRYDPEHHSIGGRSNDSTLVWFGTVRGNEICDLLKSIALAIAATKKREKWRDQSVIANLPNKIEVAKCQFGGKGSKYTTNDL